MAVIKFNKEHRNPYMFENDDYRIAYQASSTDAEEYKYSVYDKKQKCNIRLEFSEDNDKELCLSLYRDGQKPVHLKAGEPYFYKLWPVGDERKKSTTAVSLESSRPAPRSFDGLMQVYRALDKGDFIVDAKMMPANGSNKVEDLQNTAREAACEVLKFMDTYIFNTPESKELLDEYIEGKAEYASVRQRKSALSLSQRFIIERRLFDRLK